MLEYRLKNQYQEALLKSAQVRGVVKDATNKHDTTIERWANNNDPNLTMIGALEALSKHFKVGIFDLVELKEIPQ